MSMEINLKGKILSLYGNVDFLGLFFSFYPGFTNPVKRPPFGKRLVQLIFTFAQFKNSLLSV